MQDSRLIRRIVLRNYKSIAACDVRPAALSFLVGPNGSGKSNFIDAFRFVADALRYSLDHALRDRGGVGEVRRRSSGHPTHFGIRLEFSLGDTIQGHYAFTIGAKAEGAFSVQREDCAIYDAENAAKAHFRVEEGEVVSTSLTLKPAASKDRLYLVIMSGAREFRALYDSLSSMGFYNLNPEHIRDLQPPDPGELLKRDGSNLASVLSAIGSRSPEVQSRIQEYLAKVVPGICGVSAKTLGPKQTLEFLQEVRGSKHPWRFLASNMSDGTLRASGILVALFQGGVLPNGGRRLVGIEEPETALHPAAAGILTESLREASRTTQVLVTSHSPDLLDDETIPDESILAVMAEHGETKIARLDHPGRSALRDRLYTAGELMRMDQLRPDPLEANLDPDQLGLFDTIGASSE